MNEILLNSMPTGYKALFHHIFHLPVKWAKTTTVDNKKLDPLHMEVCASFSWKTGIEGCHN
jgi:hypothetical protein